MSNPISINNKYAYVANNPTMNIDPTGRVIFTSLLLYSVFAGFTATSAGAFALASFGVAAGSILASGEINHGILDPFGYMGSSGFGKDFVDAMVSGVFAAGMAALTFGPITEMFKNVSSPLLKSALSDGTLNAIASFGASGGLYISQSGLTDRADPDANPFDDAFSAAAASFGLSFLLRGVFNINTAGKIIAIKHGAAWSIIFTSNPQLPRRPEEK